MSENACIHFINYIKEFGFDTFTLVHGLFSACQTTEARRRKVVIKQTYYA